MTPETLDAGLYIYRCACRRVVDGDTLDLDIDLGLHVHHHQRVRLYGIDAPETYGVKKGSEEYEAGMRTKGEVAHLVLGKELWVETFKDKSGKYGRYLATIWIKTEDGVLNLNKHLVEKDLAVAKSY